MKGLGIPVRKRMVLELSDATVEDTNAYLAHFGIPEGSGRHDVMAFLSDGIQVLIPALLLADALFAPLGQLLPHLVRPAGLDHLCRPTEDDDGTTPPIAIEPGRLNTLLRGRGIEWVLAWFYHFPSARRCWVSFSSALHRGRLSLQPPKGRARLKLAGHLCGSTYFVTQASIVHIDIDEDPAVPLDNFPRTIVFRKCPQPSHGCTAPPRADAKLAAIRGTGKLTDHEWAAIRPLLAGKFRPSKHELRPTLSAIVCKLTTGLSWAKAEYKTGYAGYASLMYSKLVRAGLWQQIVESLERVAGAPAATPHGSSRASY